MAYALINPDNDIIRIEEMIGDDVGTKPGWRWLPIEEAGRPGFDLNTQVVEGPFQEITDTAVVKTWVVRNKTKAELLAETRAKVLSVDPKLLKIFLDIENKYRILSGQDQIDIDLYIDYLKGVV